MTEHPWMRAPALANMLGLILAALGIIIASLQINGFWVKHILIFIATVAFLVFTILFSIFLSLFIRDYIKIYPELTKKFLGIPGLLY